MLSDKLTKIVATIGPASESEEIIRALILSGANVFRFNTKHNTNEWHLNTIRKVKNIAYSLNTRVGILVDLQGPEIRIETYEGKPVEVAINEEIPFVLNFEQSQNLMWSQNKSKFVRIPQQEVFNALKVDDHFFVDDGFIEFQVISTYENALTAKVLGKATIQNRKGLNLVGRDVDLPSLTKQDMDRLKMAVDEQVDFFGLSFTRTAKDVQTLKDQITQHKSKARVVAKIESQTGVDNLHEILESADALMIARGDLGIEIPLERITHLQKEIIKACRDKNKPVIVATQMLQSMIFSPRPTRAEAADVANAVFDETDAVMLSGETATGNYPVKVVETMSKIATYNEKYVSSAEFKPAIVEQTHLVIEAAMSMLQKEHKNKIDKVVVFTETGYSARVLSSFRPKIPVIAVSDETDTLGALTLSYGITSVDLKLVEKDLMYPTNVLSALTQQDLISKGETILIIHGHKYNQPGTTNALVVLKA